jgi:predicted HicB family RNase H-like nuclease
VDCNQPGSRSKCSVLIAGPGCSSTLALPVRAANIGERRFPLTIISIMRDGNWGMALKDDRYTYRVTWSEQDQEYVGLCAEFPSLSWVARTPEAALRGVRKVVADVLKDMRKRGESAPVPIASKPYSGKFMVRVPPEVHRDLTIEAAEAGVSLNRLAAARLAKFCQ